MKETEEYKKIFQEGNFKVEVADEGKDITLQHNNPYYKLKFTDLGFLQLIDFLNKVKDKIDE